MEEGQYVKWINMTDRMPPEGVKVRTYDKDGRIRDMTLVRQGDELIFMPDELRPIYDVVWWMWKEDEA
jgi:hypothetical protein